MKKLFTVTIGYQNIKSGGEVFDGARFEQTYSNVEANDYAGAINKVLEQLNPSIDGHVLDVYAKRLNLEPW